MVVDGNYTPNWGNSRKELAARGTSVSIGNSDHTELPYTGGTATEVESKAEFAMDGKAEFAVGVGKADKEVGKGDFEEVGRVDFEVGVDGRVDLGQQGIHKHMGMEVDCNYSYYPFQMKKIKNTSFTQQIILQSIQTYNEIYRRGYTKRYTNSDLEQLRVERSC